MKTEIVVMQDRLVEYVQKKTSIEERIQTYIVTNEDSKQKLENK